MPDDAKPYTYCKTDGFEVWGKQYRNSAGEVTWRLRVFAEQDRKIETYEDVTGEPPEGIRTGESKAMRDAIAAWLEPAVDQQDPSPSQHGPRIERYINTPQILKTMTVLEAAPLWKDPRSVHLKRWGETFAIRLDEFHSGHVAAYEQERLADKVSYPTVWTEVKALRALLQHVGLGEEIESHYRTPLEKVKLTPEELEGLTSRARAYIEYLEREISMLGAEGDKMKGTLRKINWGRRR
jgi:hypothetical protein